MSDSTRDHTDDDIKPTELPSTESAFTSGESGAQIGPYRLLEKIGEGGMGEVWAAEQRVPVRRRVALKVIKPGMDTKQVIARFEAERQALAMMNHPAVAKIFDAGETPRGRPFFAMEYVEGVPITEHCDRQRLTLRERLELFVQVCAGVQHAHQKAIIHRDLKPSNVLVADSQSQVKWLIGAAIAESAIECDAATIIELANEENHGRGREFLPLGLVHASKEKHFRR